jgi:SAM-dependent methyltransferase
VGKKMSEQQKRYWHRADLDKRRSPTHPVIKAYVESKLDRILPYINLNQDTKLLDVGCGNGFFTYYFDKLCDTSGVDFSEKMLELNPVKQTFQMDAADLKFEDDSFDVVFCHALLHHVDDINAVVSEMKRVSRKYVVLLEPNRNNPLMFLFNLIVPEERRALKFSLSFVKELAIRNHIRILGAFSQGMIVPNKTPAFLLSALKPFDFRQRFGMTNFVIGEKVD